MWSSAALITWRVSYLEQWGWFKGCCFHQRASRDINKKWARKSAPSKGRIMLATIKVHPYVCMPMQMLRFWLQCAIGCNESDNKLGIVGLFPLRIWQLGADTCDNVIAAGWFAVVLEVGGQCYLQAGAQYWCNGLPLCVHHLICFPSAVGQFHLYSLHWG